MLAAALAVVITHAHAITMSPAQPVASSLAIVDGKVAYAGDDEAAARRAAGAGAEIIDVAGRTVVPGFNDAHVHFSLGATLGGRRGVDLPELPRKKWLAALGDAARGRAPGEWLFVVTPDLPDRIKHAADLDFVGHPVVVVSKHGGLVNHRAMALARLSAKETHDGFIDGVALPAALVRIVKAQPPRLLLDEARDFMGELSRLGITSVQLIAYDELPELFEALRNEGSLTARVRMVPFGYDLAGHLYHSSWRGGPAPDLIRVDGVKFFHDDWGRMTRYELQALYDDVARSGRHVVVHVLSGHALRSFLDAIERMSRAQPDKARLFRVDHVDEAGKAEAERLARLGIVVCSNPSMIPEWRSERAFPMHTLAAAGVRTCIGTDWLGRHTPPRTLSPLVSMQLAVTHGGYGTAERIDATQALEAYTVGSAAAEGMEGQKGALAPGMLADLVVLSADPTASSPSDLGSIEVLLTMVGGRVVYRRGGFAAPPPPTIGPKPAAPPPSIGPPRAPPPPSIGPPRPAPPRKR